MSELASVLAAASLVQWFVNRKRREYPRPRLPLTTSTNPVVLSETQYSEPALVAADRLRRLLESGALTPQEHALLSTLNNRSSETARVSILRNGPNKIQDIKAIRAVFKVSLRDAKDIVDNLPQTFVTPMAFAEAQTIAQTLQGTGMTVHIT